MKTYHYAEVVKKKVGRFLRGKRVDEEKHDFASWVICGKSATCMVYIAKSY